MANSILTAGGMIYIDEYLDGPVIYLSGPIEHHPDGGIEWRENVARAYDGFRFLNPWDLNDYDRPVSELTEDERIALIDTEKTAIRRSDGMLVQWPEDVPTCGTPMEILYAHQHRIPTVVWYIGKQRYPVWLDGHTDLVTPDLGACIDYLTETTT